MAVVVVDEMAQNMKQTVSAEGLGMGCIQLLLRVE